MIALALIAAWAAINALLLARMDAAGGPRR